MNRVCITINLKQRILKLTKQKFNYFIEEHLTNYNFENIVNKLMQDKIKVVYIEEVCLLKLLNIQEILDFFKDNNINIIIIYIKINPEIMTLNSLKYISIINDNFDEKIKEYENNKKSLNKVEVKKEFKFPNNVILSFALDRKVYMTTYLLNLITLYKEQKILFVEMKQSLINYKELTYNSYNKLNLTYKTIKNLKELEKIKYQEYDKVIIDLGYIYKLRQVQSLLNNLTIPILAFITSCLKVWENTKYIQEVRLLEKYNNVKIISRDEIFDKIVQESINPLKVKSIRKHIKKNKIGEF